MMGLSAEPDADELARDVAALLRPDYHYHAAHDETGRLVGFCCFGEDAQVPGGDYSLPALDIGLGLHPDLTGRGLSHSFLAVSYTHLDVYKRQAPTRRKPSPQSWLRCCPRAVAKFAGRATPTPQPRLRSWC